MSVTPKLPDFNARSAPIAAKITRYINFLLWLLVATRVGTVAISGAGCVLFAIAISRPIRAGHGFWLELFFVVAFFAVLLLMGLPILKLIKSPWFKTLRSGRPRFGPLKGPGKRQFQFILRCFSSVDLRVEPETEALLRRVGEHDALVAEAIYKQEYEKVGFDSSEWPDAWAQIQHTKFAGAEFGEAIRSNRWSIFLLRYLSVMQLVAPLSSLYAVGTFWFLADVADGRSPLPLVQFAFVGGFVIALLIFINYTVSLRVLKILGNERIPALDKALQQGTDAETYAAARRIEDSLRDSKLVDELELHGGEEVYPAITIRPGYIEGIRNEFSRDFLVSGFIDVTVLIVLLLMQWPLARVLSHWPASQVDVWTIKMIVGTALIPMALVTTLMFGFVVLSRFNRLAGVLATGVLLAVVPPLITYALRGSVGNTVLVSSLITAAVGVLPSAIAELIRQKPSLSDSP
jgi:hypothetical protein